MSETVQEAFLRGDYKRHTIDFWRLGEHKQWYTFTIDRYQFPRAFSEKSTAQWVAKRVIDEGDSKHWGRTT